jgi:lipoyl(octanoyl) transferase
VGVRVSAFLQSIAEALAILANDLGVPGAEWRSAEAGLWLRDRKLAACGLNLRRGVSIHGYAFNVRTPPEDWRYIVPCGLAGPGPISLSEALAGSATPSMEACAGQALPLLHRALAPYGLDPNARAEIG